MQKVRLSFDVLVKNKVYDQLCYDSGTLSLIDSIRSELFQVCDDTIAEVGPVISIKKKKEAKNVEH